MSTILYISMTYISMFLIEVAGYNKMKCEPKGSEINDISCLADLNSSEIPTPPKLPRTIPKYVKKLTIFQETEVVEIDDHDVFQKYSNLKTLEIQCELRFIPLYKNSPYKDLLLDSLFNVKSLNSLIIHWIFDNSYVWSLPPYLRSLKIMNSRYTTFDLSLNPYLTSINFKNNDLKRVPKLSPRCLYLESLALQNNVPLLITVEDIAPFCALKEVLLTTFNERLNDTAKYCECEKLQNWTMENSIRFVTYSSQYNCSEYLQKKDCTGYDLKKAKIIRENACSSRASLAKISIRDMIDEILENEPATLQPEQSSGTIVMRTWEALWHCFLYIFVVVIIQCTYLSSTYLLEILHGEANFQAVAE